MVVSNSTPLIYLARAGGLPLLERLFHQIQIPEEVKLECIDRGKLKGYSDAYLLEKALHDKLLIVHDLPVKDIKLVNEITEIFGIDIGEAQALVLAKRKGEKEILVDQSHAREAAKRLGLNPRGTIYIVVASIKRGLISKSEGRKLLDLIVEANFHINVRIYRRVLENMERL